MRNYVRNLKMKKIIATITMISLALCFCDVDAAKKKRINRKQQTVTTTQIGKQNARKLKVQINQGDKVSMHIYAQEGNLEGVKRKIENGDDSNEKNNFWQTPLHLAIINDHLDIAKFLVEKGADVNAVDKYGQTPLHKAVMQNRLKKVSEENRLEMVKYLVENGADVNIRDKQQKQTPLHKDVKENYLSIVEYLVQNEADYLDEALELAKKNGRGEIAEYLQQVLDERSDID